MPLFTKEELAELAAADEEIEREFRLTNDDLKNSRELDRKSKLERMDPKKRKIAENQRAYYEANREKIAENQRAYYEANREKIAENQRAYYEANREKYNKYMREYMRLRRMRKGIKQ